MSKRGYISRYLLILKKLKLKPYSTYEELQSYIENQFEFMQMQDDELHIGFSKRTLQRDLREIRNVFGIDIEYSKSQKGYYISQSENESLNFQRMIESFDMFTSLNLAQDLTPYIQLEQRKPQGTEYLYGLLHAIKNRLIIRFCYHKFWEEIGSQRTVEPLGLKEYRNRWYLMAKVSGEKNVKSYALDRLSYLDITYDRFQYPTDFNMEEKFRYCFGITSPTGEKPVDVVLSFTPFQGKYIKTLPLHHTQEVIADNKEEVRIKLRLCLTTDFLMELLSFGESMKVIEPKALIKKIRDVHERAYKQYLPK